MKALVISFMSSRRFGFLKAEDGKEVFFHLSNYQGIPRLGATVTFDLGDPIRLGQPKQAVNIQVVDGALDALASSTTASTEVSK